MLNKRKTIENLLSEYIKTIFTSLTLREKQRFCTEILRMLSLRDPQKFLYVQCNPRILIISLFFVLFSTKSEQFFFLFVSFLSIAKRIFKRKIFDYTFLFFVKSLSMLFKSINFESIVLNRLQ